VIVMLEDGALPPGLARRAAIAALQDHVVEAAGDAAVLNRYVTVNGFSARMTRGQIVAMAARGDVAMVEPMPVHEKMDAESHPLTGVDLAQAGGYLGFGTVIAIIDDGIDHDHPAFGGHASFPNAKILGGYDFADNDADPTADCAAQGHGTSVAGVAAGNGGGVTGVASAARIVMLKIQSAAICGSASLDGDIVAAIGWVAANKDAYGIDVLSMSFGGGNYGSPASCDGSSSAYFAALSSAADAGVALFAASGNSGMCDSMSRPACFSNVISVGAVYDQNLGNVGWCVSGQSCAATSPHPACTGGTRAAFETAVTDNVIVYSNSASFLDLAAPSTCAHTAANGGGVEDCFGGTSSATPFAAAVGALATEAHGSLQPGALRTLLAATGYPVSDPKNGRVSPRVTAWNAVSDTGGGGGGSQTIIALEQFGLSRDTGALRRSVAIPAGATNLRFEISGGTGEADLYVKEGAKPTNTDYDCRPRLTGNSEVCEFANPTAPSTYYLMIKARTPYAGVHLLVTYTLGGGSS
jgi:serine protease